MHCNMLYRGTDYNIIHLLLGSYSTFKSFTHMWHNSWYMFFQCKMCFLSKTFTAFVKSKFWGLGVVSRHWVWNLVTLMPKRNPVQPIQREFLRKKCSKVIRCQGKIFWNLTIFYWREFCNFWNLSKFDEKAQLTTTIWWS